MSLLMDALRKAEESKKKAESPERSEKTDKPVTRHSSPTQQPSPPPEQSIELPAAEPVTPAGGDDFATPADSSQDSTVYRSPIPDTPLQFKDDAVASADSRPSVTEESVPPDDDSGTKESRVAELQLEPQEGTSGRKPLDDPEPDIPAPESTSADIPEAPADTVAATASPALELARDSDETIDKPDAADLTIQPPPVVPPKRSPIRERTAGSRASARSVFAAKQTGNKKRQQRLLMAAGAVVIVLLLGFVGVQWLLPGSTSGISVPEGYVAGGDTFSAGGQVQRDSIEDSPEPQAAAIESQDAAGPLSTPVQQTTFFAPEQTPVVIAADEPVLEPEPATASAADDADSAATATTEAPVTAAVAESQAASEPEAPSVMPVEQDSAPVEMISFSRRESVSTIEPTLNSAYQAYQSGDFVLARQRYQAVLEQSPLHRDALLGLAAIAVTEDQPGLAMELYSRLLARNPADPVARAGLLELSPAGGPAQQERELRRLQEAHPGVAPLAYALGNFYASRQQWSDAQQHYFRALQLAKTNSRGEGDINPDYAFNLAVSLEHLNQPRAALSFYREALEQSRLYPAGFSEASVRSRVESLSRTLSP